MLDVEILTDEDHGTSLSVAPPAVIGRGDGCEIRLRHWRVARRHARLDERAEGVFVEDLGSLGGTLVNGRRILQYGPLLPEDEIVVGAVMLRVRAVDPLGHDALREGGPPAPVSAGMPAVRPTEVHAREAAMVEWRRRLHARLLEALDLRRRDVSAMSDAALRQEADRLLEALVLEAHGEIPPDLDRGALRRQVVDEAVGLGPLESLLADPDISEIMVNRHDELYVERGGVLRRHPAVFSSDQSVLGVIERIVSPLGRRIDESSPMVDARLRDGSRVNAIIAPLALKGPALTIRKFPTRRLRMSDLVDGGSLDAHMAGFLRLCVERRKNVVVSGGTGSGKTTLLNILSNFIPPAERVITIEDAAELRLAHEHLVALEARPSNLEGRGAVSIRDLVRNALRMRPDRIVVGECRGAEALDMLQAMNTGHEGSLTTLHANTPRDAMSRLETLVLMAGMDLPLGAIREQIASAIDIVVQQGRSAAGQRRVTAIVEVSGIESGRIQLQELFRFERPDAGASDGAGYFQGCELMPSFLDEWRAGGVAISPQWFCERTPAPDRPRSLA
ncbi:ATPase, T2SS/T4P/T4SS family [Pigmentiphaga sp. YJ18]|uniref:ATPase, T2SS/T4P/T4SS family n=1 Tax=Pigmentiphaga sp. YJ18 TaxID=3134907 RepID=UPI00310FA198